MLLLVSYVEYAPTGQTDGRMDGRQTVTLRFPLDAVSVLAVTARLPTARRQGVRGRLDSSTLLRCDMAPTLPQPRRLADVKPISLGVESK